MISNNIGLATIMCHVIPEIKTWNKELCLCSYSGNSWR